MGVMILSDPDQQQVAITQFLAKMLCRADDGPCETCTGLVANAMTARAYPILKQCFMACVRAGDPDAGFGAMLVCTTITGARTVPTPSEAEHDRHSGS